MDNGLLLIIAVVIGVFGILFVYKKSMAEMIEAMKQKDYDTVDKAQKQMFIRIVIVEVVPIILIAIVLFNML